MNYLLVENLTKSYGEKLLFENITFGIDKGQKVAFIARNGAGKSSLLNIIMGKDLPDNGKVTFRKDIRISYLPQNPELDDNLNIIDYLFRSSSCIPNGIIYLFRSIKSISYFIINNNCCYFKFLWNIEDFLYCRCIFRNESNSKNLIFR